MRLLYIGNFGPARSTENAYRYAFEALGCDVTCLQQDRANAWFAADNDWDLPDLLIYTRSHNHTALDYRWTGFWRFLEACGVQTASIHLDVFVGVRRYGMDGYADPLFTTGHVFTPDPLLARYIETDVTEHHWLPPAADVRADDQPGIPIEGLAGKVVFVGSRYGMPGVHDEYPERLRVLDWLHARYRNDFYWYGGGSPLGVVRGKPLHDIYASDCVIVGDSCFALSTEPRPYYWSDRIPETVAHGGCLIHPAVDGLDAAFPYLTLVPREAPSPYRLSVVNEYLAALPALIDEQRDRLPDRHRRGRAGRDARIRHTYVQRVQEILDVLELTT